MSKQGAKPMCSKGWFNSNKQRIYECSTTCAHCRTTVVPHTWLVIYDSWGRLVLSHRLLAPVGLWLRGVSKGLGLGRVRHGLRLRCIHQGLRLSCVHHGLRLRCIHHGLRLSCVHHGLRLRSICHGLGLGRVCHGLRLSCITRSIAWRGSHDRYRAGLVLGLRLGLQAGVGLKHHRY